MRENIGIVIDIVPQLIIFPVDTEFELNDRTEIAVALIVGSHLFIRNSFRNEFTLLNPIV